MAPGDDGTELAFWIGIWDATWADGGQGTNRIARILGDRVIHETFEEIDDGSGALHGQSWSVYDPKRGLWRQTWVDDQGGYLDLEGTHVDGFFAFQRAAPEIGPATMQRMVFRDVTTDAFRWTWESSPDGGASWIVRWEIDYRRRA